MRTEGRVLVTGAASGIGAACAVTLREAGWPLVLTDVTIDSDTSAEDVQWIAADLTSDEDRQQLLNAAGPLRGIVHSAGVFRLADPSTLSTELWDSVMSVNLTATFKLVQQALPSLVDGASVVLMSSVSAKLAATPESIAYAASKAAILSLTRSFAGYLAPRVRVNALCPGIIDTPMQRQLIDDLAAQRQLDPADLEQQRRASIPLGRMGTTTEVAEVARFLISDAASYMTGQGVNVTGGMIMH